jgi:glutaredoxin
MDAITIYGSFSCADCRSTKRFLKERGVSYREINIDEDPDAEELVIRVNDGKRKIPTIEVAGRYFACSPFDAEQLASELGIPLNP